MNITLDIVSLARSTNDWRSLYDVFCTLLSEYEKVTKENEQLKEQERLKWDALTTAQRELYARLQADTRKLVHSMEVSIAYFKSCGFHVAPEEDPEYQMQKHWKQTLAGFYEKHPEMKARI